MVSEATLKKTEHGLVPGEGWFVLNARDARWKHADGRGAGLSFDGWPDGYFPQYGVNLWVLGPGESIGMYHWEADQEDFFVLSGEGLLIVEGEERPLKQWDIVHCPPGTEHIMLGAGEEPFVILAIGARSHQDTDGWGAYTVDETARRHGVSVERETIDSDEAYAHLPRREPAPFREGWLPDSR
jgi:uncharacterized cupin superfamily protein